MMSYVNARWTNIQLCFYNFIRKLFNRKDYSLMTNGQSSLLWNSVIRYPDFQHHYFGQMSLPDDNKRPFSLFTAGVLVLFFYSIHFSRPELNVSCKKGFVQNWVWSWSTKLGRMLFLENFNAKDMGALNISGSLNNATFGFGKKSCWVNSFNTTQGVMRVSRWLKVT